MSLLDDVKAANCVCYSLSEYGDCDPSDKCIESLKPKITAALELAEWYGITFEEQDDGLHLISTPKRERRISERSLRVMAAANVALSCLDAWREAGGRLPLNVDAARFELEEALRGGGVTP